jgi:hypothetical protein
MATVEKQLYNAILHDRLEEAEALLRDNPDLNVNWEDDDSWTALHRATRMNHAEIVKLLLVHPTIDVNIQIHTGLTPFSLGCLTDSVLVVKLLLNDPRVDISLTDNYGFTPLWYATCGEHLEVIELMIASGKDLGDINPKRRSPMRNAIDRRNTEIVSLLRRFIANPTLTCHQVRVKLRLLDKLAAEVFALTVFVCDDLLRLKPSVCLASRFFTIAIKLPMELQMILCCRAVGSTKQNILCKDSEPAFLNLVKTLHLSQRR